MESLATDLFAVLRYLLPGFLTAWVFYGISAYEKPSQFERIIQALIFTIIVQFLVSIYAITFGNGIEITLRPTLPLYIETIVSVTFAIILGFVVGLFANKDWLHKFLRYLKVSKQTSYPSEWFGTFNNKHGYIVLHFKNGRRLYGWPQEWPESPEKGHFYMVLASWLVSEGDETYLPNEQVDGILINVKDIQFIEFMKEKTTNG